MDFSLSKIKDLLNMERLSLEEHGVVGIDIGSSSIKVIQLKGVRGHVKLETYGELQLGPYAETEIGRATNLQASRLTEALVDIVREASVTSKNAAFAISYASSFVVVITLPTDDEKQLASMVPIEARKYVPVPINEVTLDWFVVPKSKPILGENPNQTRILLAAIHNDALSKYRTVVSDAALLSSFTEIEVFSTIRSSVMNDDAEAMILDLGAATSKLYIVSHGIVERTHSIHIGAQDLTLSLSETLGISVAEAEELKRQVGLTSQGGDARVTKACTDVLDQIFNEAERVVMRHEAERQSRITKIILTGGGGVLKGLSTYASESFDRETALADPFSKVEYPAFLEDTLKAAGPSFTVAMGIALRRLNE